MDYETFSFRHAEVILNEPQFVNQFTELRNIINNITDNDLIERHESYANNPNERVPMSLSVAINELLKERFEAAGWQSESPIFQEPLYLAGDRWRLDFAKDDISIEVAFNHGEATAWNLIKPVLASELNHVQKAIQTQVGVIITATQSMKSAGGFDGAVGTFEKFIEYLPPMRDVLSVPILIIGLLPPRTFRITRQVGENRRNYGVISQID